MTQSGKDATVLPVWRRSLAISLLRWFRKSARDLPWRRTRDLYAIWISEIMLQQTQVATVIPYWERFMSRFPDVQNLAAAREQEVLKLWEGLGYYRRARQLHLAARQIAAQHNGAFPMSLAEVRSLPGIGRYTAGAILSIGLDQRLPILEANTIRVLSRLTGYRGDVGTTAGQRHLWSIAEAILPRRQCGAFNQALMELGSEICTPRSAQCNLCPVMELCQAHRDKAVDRIPLPAKRTNYEEANEVAVVIRHRGRVLLRQCQSGERWAGLWDFPRFAAPGEQQNGSLGRHIRSEVRRLTGFEIQTKSRLVTIKHGVTRFRITLDCYEATLLRGARQTTSCQSEPIRWVAPRLLGEYPLSVTGRKISRLLTEKQPTRGSQVQSA
jgi:A/G-specific adenine glycosylase